MIQSAMKTGKAKMPATITAACGASGGPVRAPRRPEQELACDLRHENGNGTRYPHCQRAERLSRILSLGALPEWTEMRY